MVYRVSPEYCHIRGLTYLSVAKQTREFNDRHGKNTNKIRETHIFWWNIYNITPYSE